MNLGPGAFLRRRVAAARALTLSPVFCLLLLSAGSALAQTSISVSPALQGRGLTQALTTQAGDPQSGRAILLDRRLGMCLLCHSGPFPEERLQGNLASDLRGVALRRSAAQLRLQLVDARRLNSDTLMPSYFSTEGLLQVGERWRGRTLLEAQQIEDLIAFLLTLREPGAGS